MKKILVLSFFIAINAHAAFMINTQSGYLSSTDTSPSSNTTFSNMTNSIFIGASLGQKQRWYIGQNVTIMSYQLKTSNTDKLSTTEIGPRAIYYFNDENTFYTSATWNPYAKGTRSVAGTSDKVSGFSYNISLGTELKITRGFFIGGSINYYSYKMSEAVSSANVSSTISKSYSTIMPMINLSFRFR